MLIVEILACIVGLLVILMLIGTLMPVKHTAVIEAELNALPEIVWKRIAEVENYPVWRKGVTKVEKTSPTQWTEYDRHRGIPYRILESEPNASFKVMIDTKKLAYGGTWHYELQAKGNDTFLRITEAGEIYNPFFRFMAKCFLGYDMTLKKYMSDLKKAL